MATRKRKYPELELPTAINAAVIDYLGPRLLNKLSANQKKAIAEATQACGIAVGQALAAETD